MLTLSEQQEVRVIELKGVCKSFGSLMALHPLDHIFLERKTSVLIGQSGCGKSTLLRLITGLIPPDQGQIHIDGKPLEPSTVQGIRHSLGYVIQDGGLFPHLTASANVTMMARYLGHESQRVEERLRELADLTHFPTSGLDRYPSQLSGGQRQRVSLMRALMLDPKILLLDEPLGALDPLIRYELQKDLKEIFQTLKKTVVMVTHDMGEAAYFGDEILLLNDGKVVQKGPIQQFIQSPAETFVTQFLTAQRSPFDEASPP